VVNTHLQVFDALPLKGKPQKISCGKSNGSTLVYSSRSARMAVLISNQLSAFASTADFHKID
jgi:hypothetical protein